MSRVYWFSAVRTFGFAMILIYHLFIAVLPGGFLGVDISFTLSGFLITALIMEEVRRREQFDLFRFLRRRSQRIFVPLLFILIFTLPLALLISPDFTVGINKQLAAALGFVTNFREIAVGSSYEAQLLPSLYIHTWSLAVEMHFYLFWGCACTVIALAAKKWTKNPFNIYRKTILIASIIITAASFTYMIMSFNAGVDINAIYFNTFKRFFAFFIGATAAAVWGLNAEKDEEIKKRFFSTHVRRKTAGLIAVCVAIAAFFIFYLMQFSFEDAFIYRYGLLTSALLTVALIYCAHALQLVTPQRIKEPKLLKASADMSYDMYLIHWPLYVVLSALMMNLVAASFAALFLTIVFAWVMVYGVERIFIPYNKKEVKHMKPIAAGIIALAVIASVGGIAVMRRAPVVTSIEADFSANYTLMDVYNILDARDAVGETPVVYTGLSANVLPEPETVHTFAPVNGGTDYPGGMYIEPDGDDDPHEDIPVPEGVTVIGCSVVLGAQANLRQEIPHVHVDAAGSRQVNMGYELMMELQENDLLREYVVIALGTNVHRQFEEWFMKIINDLNPGHRLIFVTPFDGRSNNNLNAGARRAADFLRELPQEYDFITIADWNLLIQDHQNLLSADRVHLGHTSRIMFTQMVQEALEVAAARPVKPIGDIRANSTG